MKKTAIIFMAIMTLAMAASGKVMRRTLGIFQSKVPETETIAPETMEFVYDYSWCNDTTGQLEDNYTTDQMLLQIGPKRSLQILQLQESYSRFAPDEHNSGTGGRGRHGRKTLNGEFMTIFKNYPQGKLTHTEKICMDWFCYEDDMPELEWELTDSVTNVLGYECHSAVCNFRGREWMAFYSEEIPLMEAVETVWSAGADYEGVRQRRTL